MRSGATSGTAHDARPGARLKAKPEAEPGVKSGGKSKMTRSLKEELDLTSEKYLK
jgi:hypothetical protein